MHVLLIPVGSHGDVHPFVGLGLELRARGHRVTFFLNEHFGPLVRGLGFEMVALGEEGQFEEALRDPDLWHPRRGLATVARYNLEYTGMIYRALEAYYEPGAMVAAGGSLAFGMRLAQERLGLPAATVHLQPSVLHSNHETPVYGRMGGLRHWPRWLKRRLFDLAFTRVVDPLFAPGLNALRAEIGLPPLGRDVFRCWRDSPELIVGLFPAWFGPPQPDWPPHVVLTDFPLYDERDATPLPPGLDAFLDAGPPPIAFTPGSANVHGRPFFEAAVDACRRLGRRGLLLTRHPAQIPADLPDGVIHVPYAPFGLLLPRVAALVHHGGIGTCAQALAAGVPQLIMPLAHDQFDNVDRLRRLGVARSLLPHRFRGPAVADALRALLDSPSVASSCRAVAARIPADGRGLALDCDALDTLGRPEIVPA